MTDAKQVEAALGPVAAGRASVRMKDGCADIILDVTGLPQAARDALEADVKGAAAAVPGVEQVRIAQTQSRVERTLIAIASGKGGVGKSTVSANLAIALARGGRKVGLVDADIYGPSQPKLMGVEGTKPQAREKTLLPVPTPYDVPILSMGQMVDAGSALAWRGPMAASALGQLVDADWGDRDTILIDLPPGTGDVQLTMVQKHKPAGAVIVCTPQDLALIDARRAIDLFTKTGVPILGIVENMAGYTCPECGAISDPFGRGGAEAAANDLGVPFLGRIPLDIAIRTSSDAGTPPAAGNGAEAEAFVGIAKKVAERIATLKG
ncbi:Mrp/NBP35 family ATP-binding protein [Stakelama pacifica]|uniref:Iron-sulfur cluster carrier protein n=1 Tax=Stakelama pacifica TaxID=517720 RepID=A0A4R6FUJ6_9SPHN|nr:Mrp/NBP35 family ATP-binding protein [Stakelama pacifica]TDN85491.1 ATP-binding protein involved in chromosome partitioning [Stakelama pacifica]GGO92495.1 iron-sulfur cluster carrier protein [Stakelama pacifica]